VSEERSKPRWKRRVIALIAAGVTLLALAVFAGWYLRSPQFHEWARQKLVSRLEQVTGGRVEIANFQWSLSQLQFDIHDLTIHGLEGPDQIPYLHADRLLIRARIVSLWRRQIALNSVEVDRPVVHLIV